MKKNFSPGNPNIRVTVTFDKEFLIPVWSAKAAREIISEEVDRLMCGSDWAQIQVSETNYIIYVSFALSITAKNAQEVKDITERIEGRLFNDEGSAV